MELSERLSAICRMVTPGLRIADIGTDHGYVPVQLTAEGKVPSALAMDLREGPLEHARQTVERYGVGDKVMLRLSNGLEALHCGEADCAVIAGMGGDLIVRILEAYPDVAASLQELVLGPQSELSKVRAFLREHGWQIADEDMVCEDGKYYPLIRAVSCAERKDAGRKAAEQKEAEHKEAEQKVVEQNDIECKDEKGKTIQHDKLQQIEDLYGPVLLLKSHPVLCSYLTWEEALLQRNMHRLETAASASALMRRAEIEEKLKNNHLAQEICGVHSV